MCWVGNWREKVLADAKPRPEGKAQRKPEANKCLPRASAFQISHVAIYNCKVTRKMYCAVDLQGED